MSSNADRDLERDLDAIALKASRVVNRRRTQRALPRIIDSAAPWLVAAPALFLVIELGRRIFGGDTEPVTAGTLVLWTLLLPLGVFGVRFLLVTMKAVSRREALFAADQELDLEERLVTADEFMSAKKARTAFEAAAVEDALEHARVAREAEIPLEQYSEEPSPRVLGYALVALFLAIFTLSLAPLEKLISGDFQGDTDVAGGVTVAEREPEEEIVEAPTEPRIDERSSERRDSSKNKSEDAASERYSGELPPDAKEGRGKTVAGQTSEAQSGKSASNSKGQTSTQSQTAKGKESRKLPPKKKKNESKEAKDEDPNTKEVEEPSGSTAGRGSGSGSNKNPASTDWSSKDNVESFDDEPTEDDEEVDDEESDSDARGGVQPALRDRRPPVSRDLQIGFGNQPNPDANGRGGPSQQKKSRGVASLVLGVPIPDNVKGKPNPGKTKITQERIEPKSEDASPIVASKRPERDAPVGHLTRRELAPWMKDLVRSYFLKIRTRDEG